MSDEKWQDRRGPTSFNSVGELLEEVKKRAANQPTQEIKKGKGLEFMALRLDVAEKHLELAVKKKITPAEDNLLKIIEMGTIGARNSRSQICSKAMVHISDLSEKLGYKEKDKIWKLLKSLYTKGYITREKTRNKDQEVIGLNPKVFGQILAEQQHEREKKRHLRLVDNCGSHVDKSTDNSSAEPTDHRCSTDSPSVPNRQTVGTEPTDHPCSDFQDIEMTRENLSLDSSRSILDSFRGHTGTEETNVSKKGTRSQEEHERKIRDQLELMKAGKL